MFLGTKYLKAGRNGRTFVNLHIYCVNGLIDQPELKNNPRIHLVEAAISKTDRISHDGAPFMTLPTILKDNGHSWVDFLKVSVKFNFLIFWFCCH